MDKIDRIATIGSSILTQAEQESRATIDKANQVRAQELKSAEEKIVAEMGERLQRETAKIRHEAWAVVAAERTRARENLLRRRDGLTKLVFSGVRKLLADYSHTKEYTDALLSEIGSIGGAYDHTASTVYLCEDDMIHCAAIEKLLPGCMVQASGEIRIGGWRLLNTKASVLIDQSYDTRLRDQKDWYLEHCNLEVTR
jgi:vacuolar-type H+-ATPase subunit H